MEDAGRSFTLDELCGLVDLPRRTVRYYIQVGLVDRPEGAGRGAHYGQRHLEQLLEIRKWQGAGLALERIRELLRPDALGGAPLPPPRPRQRGGVEVWSHLLMDEGVELLVEPRRSELTPEQVRALAEGVMALYQQIRTQKKE
jgi:DNA-binding transcriptional MerR regulator